MAATKPGVKSAQDIWARTQLLVEVLLMVIEQEIFGDGEDRSADWVRLFGTRDSAVAILQKLVKLMAELQEQSPQASSAQPNEPTARIGDGELKILREFLATLSAANVSTAAE